MESPASALGGLSRAGAASTTAPSGWRRWADRLAWLAWVVLATATTFGLLAGATIAIVHRPEVDWSAYDGPFALQKLGYLLVLALSLPSLAVGSWDLLRGRRAQVAARLLAFFGPLLVVLGAEGLVSHFVFGCAVTGWACPDGDFTIRWHQLHHTLVAGLPLTLLYGLALRRWRPALVRFGRFAR